MVGHHAQLSAWLKGKASGSLPRVWVKGKETDSLGVRPKLGPMRDELNHVTSSTAKRVLMSLLTGETLHASIPGVAGMPGGYPFVLNGGKFTLRLPSSVSSDEAIAHNKRGEQHDGLDLGLGAKFIGQARRFLTEVHFEYAQGFDLCEWQKVCDKMVRLRDRLRRIAV